MCTVYVSVILFPFHSTGESIPIRLFLSGYDLTPTMRDINKKFSVRYYINLVLVDEEERRYFKQQVSPPLAPSHSLNPFSLPLSLPLHSLTPPSLIPLPSPCSLSPSHTHSPLSHSPPLPLLSFSITHSLPSPPPALFLHRPLPLPLSLSLSLPLSTCHRRLCCGEKLIPSPPESLSKNRNWTQKFMMHVIIF